MIKRVDTRGLFQSTLSKEQRENSALNLSEGDEGFSVLKSFPRRLVIELTNRCNLNCIMCGRTGHHFEYTDFHRDWFKVLEPAFSRSEEIVLHGWGEPLMYKGFSDLMKYLNQFPLRKYFCTNGMLLDQHWQELFDHHLDILAISMDGASPSTNDRIRNGAKQETVLKNIHKIVEYKKQHQLDFPYMNFVFTAMKDNIQELPDMIDLAASMEIPEVKLVYLTAFDEELALQSLFDQQSLVKKYFLLAEERAQKKNIILKIPYIQGEDPSGDEAHKKCYFPFRDLFIGSDGFVRPCMSNSERLVSIESIHCFDDLWNHEKMRDLRKNMTPECQHCYHSSCANWNKKTSFIQLSTALLPEWEYDHVKL